MTSLTPWLRRAALALPLIAAAGTASALSCAPPSLEGAYSGWDKAKERYYVVSGTLTPAQPLPAINGPNPSTGRIDSANLRAVYRIQGEDIRGLSSVPVDHYIWVRVGCLASWCGQFPRAGTSGVMGLKQLPDGTLELGIGACPGAIFNNDGGAAKARVQQCMTTGCAPTPTR